MPRLNEVEATKANAKIVLGALMLSGLALMAAVAAIVVAISR